jgi:hypothetical protein
VTVPETAVDHHNFPSGWKDKVRPSGQSAVVKNVSIAEAMKQSTDSQLWHSILRSDTTHQSAAPLGRNSIHT